MKYTVTIIETRAVDVEIEAKNWDEARDIAKDNWSDSIYEEELSEGYCEVEFKDYRF